jgi:hypothetical protein
MQQTQQSFSKVCPLVVLRCLAGGATDNFDSAIIKGEVKVVFLIGVVKCSTHQGKH